MEKEAVKAEAANLYSVLGSVVSEMEEFNYDPVIVRLSVADILKILAKILESQRMEA
jgi:hypothetical protein